MGKESGTDDGKPSKVEFTDEQQAEVDRVVEARLKRERAKYADYDELKTKVAELEKKSGGDNKGENEKLTEQIATLQRNLEDERRERTIVEVAAAKGLTPAHVKRLSGTTREELEDSADELLADFPIPEKKDGKDGDGNDDGRKRPPSQRPTPDLRGGGDPSESPMETDPAKLAESVPRL